MAKDTKGAAKKGNGDKGGAKKGTNKAAIGASAKDLGFEFGVTELAEELGIEPASARVKLRNAGIEKDGAVYGWRNRKAFMEVVRELQGDAKKSSSKEGSSKKSASKKDAKASSKKASSKKAQREEPEDQGDGEDDQD